jgi:hypothetical protein
VLWRVQLTGKILALSQDDRHLAVCTRGEKGEEEGWVYQLASMTLRNRSPGRPTYQTNPPVLAAVHAIRGIPLGTPSRLARHTQGDTELWTGKQGIEGLYPLVDRMVFRHFPTSAGTEPDPLPPMISIYKLEKPAKVLGTVQLLEAQVAWIRPFGGLLLLGSDRGQVVVLDAERWEVLWESRV